MLIRKLLTISALCTSLVIGIHLYLQPKGFKDHHSMMPWRPNPAWEIERPSIQEQQNLSKVFSQSYHFLSAGYQAYAFESEDGKYILKFFRMNHLVPRTLHYLRPKKVAKRKGQLDNLFDGYKAVYDRFKEGAGLLFIHLNKSNYLNTTLRVKDRKNVEHEIELDKVAFVVQEKAEVLENRLHRLKNENKLEELEATAKAFLVLVQQRIDAGLTDDDLGIIKNYGFIGDRPIHFDVGRVHIGSQPNEYKRLTEKIELTLQTL